MTFNLLPSARKLDIVLFIPLHLYMKYKCTNWFFKMIIKTSKNIVLKIWIWTLRILHQFKKIGNLYSKGKLCVISGPSIVLMPRQLISKKCWKPLQGKGISQKSAHLTNLTSALTVYTRILRRPKKCMLFFHHPDFIIIL